MLFVVCEFGCSRYCLKGFMSAGMDCGSSQSCIKGLGIRLFTNDEASNSILSIEWKNYQTFGMCA